MSAIWKVISGFPEEKKQEVIDMREFVITVNKYCRLTQRMAGRETCSGSSVEIYN